MKSKLLSIVIIVMVLGITGCGSSTTESSNDNNQTAESESVSSDDADTSSDENNDTEAEEKEDSDDEKEAEETSADEGELGDYYVKIKKATFGKDYDGNKIIVVHYDFTNNDKKAQAALFSINVQAYQDGIELENAIVMDDDVYDAGISQKKVKKGKTMKNCQEAFVLTGKEPVEVEITELISFDDDEKITKTFKVKK